MKKLIDQIKEYKERFFSVPTTEEERFNYIISQKSYKEKDFVYLNERIVELNNMPYDSFSFIIYLTPTPSPRPRFMFKTRRAYVFNAADNSNLFEEFLISLKEARPDLICTPCEIYMNNFIEIPDNMNKIDKLLAEGGFIKPVSTTDFDNLAKTYTDMTQKHLLLNDSLVTDAIIRKRYSVKPRIEITIRYQRFFESNYTKKKVEGWKYFKDLKNKPDIRVY